MGEKLRIDETYQSLSGVASGTNERYLEGLPLVALLEPSGGLGFVEAKPSRC